MTSKSRSFDGIIADSNSGITDEQANAIVSNTNTITALSESIDTLIPTLISGDNSDQTKLGGFIANYLGITNANYSLTKDVDDNFVFTIPTGEKYIFKIGTDQIIELSNTGFNTANTNISYKISGTDIQNKFLDKTSGGVVSGNTSFTSNFSLYGSNNVMLNATSDIEKWTMAFGAIVAGTNVEYCNSKGCVFNNGTQNIVLNGTTTLNNSLELASTVPISFGNYSFRPQQFYKDITGFSFNHTSIGATNLLFNTGFPAVAEWTNRNTGATNQPIDLINNSGAYKITIRQTTNGALGQINGMHIMSDMVLTRPNDNAPNVELPAQTAYSYNAYDGIAPIITMNPGFLSWAVHATFPGTTGNETANIRVTLTHMPYF